jgi:hypothetical protein
MNQEQQQAIDYLREENRVLREQLGGAGFDLPTISVAGSQPRPRTRTTRSG